MANKSAAKDVADILSAAINPFTSVAQSIGIIASTASWGIYINQEPSKPSNCITIYDAGGLPPIPCMNKAGSEDEFSQPNIQIRVRSTDYASAYSKIMDCYEAIHNRGGYDTTTFNYSGFFAQSLPLSIGEDSNNRGDIVVNFVCSRARIDIGGHPNSDWVARYVFANTDFLGDEAGGCDLTNNNVVTNPDDATRGYVAAFDGVNQYFSDAYNGNATGDATWATWVNPNVFNKMIFGNSASGNEYIWLRDNNTIRIVTSEGVTRAFDGVAMTVNNWYYVTVTRISGTIRVYTNATESTTGGIADSGSLDLDLIGAYNGGSLSFDGEQDNSTYWTRGLSAAEVTENYDYELLPQP